MSTHDPLQKLASVTDFHIKSARRDQLVAHVQALEEPPGSPRARGARGSAPLPVPRVLRPSAQRFARALDDGAEKTRTLQLVAAA